MRKLLKSWVLYAWLVIGTLTLAFIWGNYPYLFFYPPESFSTWLIDMYGSSNGEELADLELLYVFVCSFFIIVVITVLFCVLKKALIG
jgi:hypothetical protein